MADFNLWRKNRKRHKLEFNWCDIEADRKIFELIEEHRKLTTKPKSNWFWPFRDSVAIKQRLLVDFKDAFTKAALRRLADNGQIPFLELSCQIGNILAGGDRLQLNFTIRNLSSTAAIAPKLQLAKGEANCFAVESIAPNQLVKLAIEWHFDFSITNLPVQLSYAVLTGHLVMDEGMLTVRFSKQEPHKRDARYELKNRWFTGATNSAVLVVPKVHPVG